MSLTSFNRARREAERKKEVVEVEEKPKATPKKTTPKKGE